MPENETRFISLLSEILGSKYIVAKPKGDIQPHIKPDYSQNQYIKLGLNEAFDDLLKHLGSTRDFSNKTLPVDCLIIDHPEYSTRIVEFDEYQHFSMYRALTINHLSSLLKYGFYPDYLTLINDPQVKLKHEKTISGRSGFSKPVRGFNVTNGRMIQRAYFDALKDVTHLSSYHMNYSPIIRFSIFEFESVSKKSFDLIDSSLIKDIVAKKLNDYK